LFNEKSAGFVLFQIDKGIIRYLLLRHGLGHWGFPKGNIEMGEKEQDAGIREVQEETGISKIVLIDNFREKVHYIYKRQGKTIHKEVVYFLAKSNEKEVTLSFEHSEYKWLCYEDSLKQLNFENAKTVLMKANQKTERI